MNNIKHIINKILLVLSIIIVSVVILSAILFTVIAIIEAYKANPSEMSIRLIFWGVLILFITSLSFLIDYLEKNF